MSFQGCSERLLRSAWVTSDPSGSRRSRSRSLAETISSRPSGRKSMQNGNDSTRRMTSLLPSRSTAMISWAPQSENQSRLSCQRGDSPNTMSVIRVCSSVIYLLLSIGNQDGTRRNSTHAQDVREDISDPETHHLLHFNPPPPLRHTPIMMAMRS